MPNLVPNLWSMYHVDNCRHAKPLPKPKFVAIVCNDTDFFYGFLINRNRRPWILNSPYRISCQASILAAEHHPWLRQDSFIDCLNLFSFWESELANYQCDLSDNAKTEIKRAVTISKGIETIYKDLILV